MAEPVSPVSPRRHQCEIEKHLLELHRIRLDRWQRRVELRDQHTQALERR